MRRLVLVVSAVLVATFLVSFAALAEPADRQYESSDGREASKDRPKSPEEAPAEQDFVSQGSTGGNTPEAWAARRDLAEEERLPDYSQVVDNSQKARFKAPKWEQVAGGKGSHGGNYAYAEPGSDARPATFRVKIPSNNDYAVYAWWPAAKSNAPDARIEISTAKGTRKVKADETRDGGIWIKLGAFPMKKGERAIRVLPSRDANVVADAVAVVRGEYAPPPEETAPATEDGMMRAASVADGYDIARQAKRYIGKKYKWGTCTRYYMSCTCLTKRAVAPFGHNFPMTELGQWRYEPSAKIARQNLRVGDIIFYTEPYPPSGIDHVGVFSGGGNIVHSSSFYNRVVESEMRYLKGYYGAIRVWPR